MDIIETSTIGIGPTLQGQQHHIGQAETTSCWIDDFEGYPEGCTFQHKCSFVGVDVHELYSIHVIQYITFIYYYLAKCRLSPLQQIRCLKDCSQCAHICYLQELKMVLLPLTT
jgi:hypothetical protein